MSENNFQLMFLLGTGSSIPAGLPDIGKLTKEFMESEVNTVNENKISILMDVAENYFSRRDIESFLSLLNKLKDENDRSIFKSKYSQLENIQVNDLSSFISNAQKFIRIKLENITTIDYFSYIRHLPFNCDVFTLNYDCVLDNTLEEGNINWTDGFNPLWNPALFEKTEIKFKLYKLHGSLYWFTTSKGKLIKIPIRGLDVSKIKYLTGEDLNEVLIYPTIQKDKFSSIYNFLNYTFTQKLNKSNLCVIIGYSFRDIDITEMIKESVRTNDDLWLLVISPNADKLKDDLKKGLDEEQRMRILFKNSDIEGMLKDAQLINYIYKIRQNINKEKNLWSRINPFSLNQLRQDNTYVESTLSTITREYKELGIVERSRYLLSRVLKENKISEEIHSKLEGPLNLSY